MFSAEADKAAKLFEAEEGMQKVEHAESQDRMLEDFDEFDNFEDGNDDGNDLMDVDGKNLIDDFKNKRKTRAVPKHTNTSKPAGKQEKSAKDDAKEEFFSPEQVKDLHDWGERFLTKMKQLKDVNDKEDKQIEKYFESKECKESKSPGESLDRMQCLRRGGQLRRQSMRP